MSVFQNSYTRPEVWVARWRTVAWLRGALMRGLPSASKPSSTCLLPNAGRISATGVSGFSLPRSIRIIAAVLPTALVIEKMRNTVSWAAGRSARARPAAPDQVTPAALPVMPTTNGTWSAATASDRMRSSSDMDVSWAW